MPIRTQQRQLAACLDCHLPFSRRISVAGVSLMTQEHCGGSAQAYFERLSFTIRPDGSLAAAE
jgi:hypothetical protein